MSKIVTLVLIIGLISCQHYKIDYDKFTINEVVLKQNQSKDSLSLKVDYTIPPKSFGKKALLVCHPIIVYGKDTLKFRTRTSVGEKYKDCIMVSYKLGARIDFTSKIAVEHSISDSALFIVQFTQYKREKEPLVLFEKFVGDLINLRE